MRDGRQSVVVCGGGGLWGGNEAWGGVSGKEGGWLAGAQCTLFCDLLCSLFSVLSPVQT